MQYIIPLTKSPLPHKGRAAKVEWQDWYQGLVLAAKLAKCDPQSQILVVSAVHVDSAPPEANLYGRTLRKLGVRPDQILVIKEAQETIGQIETVLRDYGRDQLEFVVAPSHYFRVLWFLRGVKNISVTIGWGLPRWKELLTDVILTFLFPIIDLCGGRKWFQDLVEVRRRHGNQF